MGLPGTWATHVAPAAAMDGHGRVWVAAVTDTVSPYEFETYACAARLAVCSLSLTAAFLIPIDPVTASGDALGASSTF